LRQHFRGNLIQHLQAEQMMDVATLREMLGKNF
jgi:hypothetical protein